MISSEAIESLAREMTAVVDVVSAARRDVALLTLAEKRKGIVSDDVYVDLISTIVRSRVPELLSKLDAIEELVTEGQISFLDLVVTWRAQNNPRFGNTGVELTEPSGAAFDLTQGDLDHIPGSAADRARKQEAFWQGINEAWVD